jgi:hypothetical protein
MKKIATSSPPPQEWFEMPDLRRRRFATAVWVPLRSSETILEVGKRSRPGFVEEILYAASVAFPLANREEAEKLGWMDIGIRHSGGPCAFRDGTYKPCEVYQYSDGDDLGVDLVFEQHVRGGHPNVWHLNQDLVLALNLLQENDVWVRPEEDYVIVARQRRDAENRVVAIEIRSDFLRDYLAARGMALRLYYYRQRQAVVDDASYLKWPEDGLNDNKPHDRFSARVFTIGEDGGPYGGDVAVFHMWRTDVDPHEDVPIFDRESDGNTDATSTRYTRKGPKFYRAEGELWRGEWIEPAERSERVRGDDPVDTTYFIVDASGARQPATALDSEDIGRYLWFDPKVILALSERRGGGLAWYTRDTGSVWCSEGYRVHFGSNRLSLITVYAYDVAKLPLWQQRIWAGHNIAPDGAVSAELLDAQMRGVPARTRSAEKALPKLMDGLDAVFEQWVGSPLFRHHEATAEILRTVHRFRAVDRSGLLALAKDVARLTADRIDLGTLRKIISPPKGENWGSLKSLERVLGTLVPNDRARTILTPLVGVYGLRLGDAHLPSSEIDEAFTMVGIDPTVPFIEQGRIMLERTADVLFEIGQTLSSALNPRQSSDC